MRNWELEIAIVKSKKKKRDICESLGWTPSKLSSILYGPYKPSTMEQEVLCNEIGCEVNEAFVPIDSGANHV